MDAEIEQPRHVHKPGPAWHPEPKHRGHCDFQRHVRQVARLSPLCSSWFLLFCHPSSDAPLVQGLDALTAEERAAFYTAFKVPKKAAAAFDKAHPPPEPAAASPPPAKKRRISKKAVAAAEEKAEEAEEKDDAEAEVDAADGEEVGADAEEVAEEGAEEGAGEAEAVRGAA